MFTVTVLKIKRIEGKPQLRAFADVSLSEEVSINSIRLMDDGKGYWLGFPQTEYESQGKKKYSPIVEASEGLKKQIREAIVAAYKESN